MAASALLLGVWMMWPSTPKTEPSTEMGDEKALLDAFRQEAGIELEATDRSADEEALLTREIIRQTDV